MGRFSGILSKELSAMLAKINKPTLTIGVAVITHNAKKHLPHCLPLLLNSPLKPRVLVVNSSSHDGTVEMAQQLGAETLVIPRAEFNHGTTREKARHYLQTEIVVMITPDAYLIDSQAFNHLLEPLLQGKASIAYARQIPHDGADFFEAFPREYNYPPQSHIRSIQETEKYGVYTFFCSNSCAAYINAALDEGGGFQSVLLGEDTVAVANLLRKGHKIAYVAEALVKHSHRYSLLQELRRNFDIGLARKQCGNLLACEGSDTQRGMDYVRQMTRRLLKERPRLIPYAFLHVLAKWLGYRLGHASVQAPVWFKKLLSSQSFYWVSLDFIKNKKELKHVNSISKY
jgi:rhamnosyltransferase